MPAAQLRLGDHGHYVAREPDAAFHILGARNASPIRNLKPQIDAINARYSRKGLDRNPLSALMLYWVTSNLLQIVQQFWIGRYA